jgi:hypothetical protein
MNKLNELTKLAKHIDTQTDWWRFPTEGQVQGFMGTDTLFFVGDQPSTSEWGPTSPSRRAFYDCLPLVGAADAHLTDLYKKRGKSGALKDGLPSDFPMHVDFFRSEMSLLRPTRVIAVGHFAFDLLTVHIPEVRPILHRIHHFSYIARYKRYALYEGNMRLAMGT